MACDLKRSLVIHRAGNLFILKVAALDAGFTSRVVGINLTRLNVYHMHSCIVIVIGIWHASLCKAHLHWQTDVGKWKPTFSEMDLTFTNPQENLWALINQWLETLGLLFPKKEVQSPFGCPHSKPRVECPLFKKEITLQLPYFSKCAVHVQEIFSKTSKISKQIRDRGASKLLSHQINVYWDKMMLR